MASAQKDNKVNRITWLTRINFQSRSKRQSLSGNRALERDRDLITPHRDQLIITISAIVQHSRAKVVMACSSSFHLCLTYSSACGHPWDQMTVLLVIRLQKTSSITIQDLWINRAQVCLVYPQLLEIHPRMIHSIKRMPHLTQSAYSPNLSQSIVAPNQRTITSRTLQA